MRALGNYRGYIILSLVYALAFGGYLLYERRPQPEPIVISQPTATPTGTPAPLYVHVVGAVFRPGVYALSAGSRVAEAAQAAGGLSAEADEERVNLAEPVRDGQQVYIPHKGTPLPPSPIPLQPLPTTASGLAVGSAAKININTASPAELDTLPGIGPAYAGRIVAYRDAHGPFTDIAQIMDVQGIGPATFENIKELITVE